MKIFTGKVLHTKMDKTAVVEVERVFPHSVYKKRIKRTKKYYVHDEIGVESGQVVKFVASKPYSKLKKWKVIQIPEGNKKKTKSGNRKKAKVTKVNKKQ